MHKAVHVTVRLFIAAAIVFPAALSVLVIGMQSRPGKAVVARLVSRAAAQHLGAELTIGRLDGTFWSSVSLEEVSLIFQSDTLIAFSRLQAGYTLRRLWKKQLIVDSLMIEKPFVNLRKSSDGELTLLSLFTKQPLPEKMREDAASPSKPHARPFEFLIDQFVLRHGRLDYDTQSPYLPRQIDSLHITASARIGIVNRIELKRLSFTARQPDLQVKNLSFNLQYDSAGLSLQNVLLRTAKNHMTVSAVLHKPFLTVGEATLQADSLDVEEFSFRLPSLRLPGRPFLSLQTSLVDDRITAALVLKSREALLAVQGWATNWREPSADTHFSLRITLDRVQISDWLASMTVPAQITATAELIGSGNSLSSLNAQVRVRADNCIYNGLQVKGLLADLRLDNGRLNGEASLQTAAGRVRLKARVEEPFTKQRFKVGLAAEEFDLAGLSIKNLPSSRLNVNFEASGSSFDFRQMTAAGTLQADSSFIVGIPVDSLRMRFTLKSRMLAVDPLKIYLPDIAVVITGTTSLEGESNLQLAADFQTLQALRALLAPHSADGNGSLIARLDGRLISPTAEAALHATAIRFDSLSVDSLSLFAEAAVQNGFSARFSLQSRGLEAGGIPLQHLAADGTFHDNLLNLRVAIDHPVGSLAASAAATFRDSIRVDLRDLVFDFHDQLWRINRPHPRLTIGADVLRLDEFILEQAVGDTVLGRIRADGTLSRAGGQDFVVELSRFDLTILSRLFRDFPATGWLDGRLLLRGDAHRPIIDLQAQTRGGCFRKFFLRDCRLNARYADELAAGEGWFSSNGDSLTIAFALPMVLSVADGKMEYIPRRPIYWRIDGEGLQIGRFFSGRQFFDDLQGKIDLYAVSNDSLSFFRPQGSLILREGHVLARKWGFEIGALQGKATLSPERIVLEELTGWRGSGRLALNGSITLADPIGDVSVRLRADRFTVSDRPMHELQMQANLFLRGEPDALTLGGEVTILQAAFHTAVFTSGGAGKREELDLPLLVRATAADPLPQPPANAADRPADLQVLKNLHSEIKIRLPRNVWIYNNNMRIELSGDIDMLQSPHRVELFGTIRAQRGWYDFLGKRFTLAEGEATFQGGEKIDPQLSLKADYVFRDGRRNRRTLRLKINGRASTPEFSFTLDDSPLTEGEAITYLLFGRSPEEMGGTQALQAGLQPERLATDAVTAMLSAQITRRLGTALNLDVVELQGQDNFNAAAFVVGKYLTPDLFLSYEQSFGALEEDHPSRMVTVEYELTKRLFFQLISGDTKSSGADVVFKWSK